MGEIQSYEYFDDNEGGVESECLLRATLQSGAKVTVELSRNRKLRNTARLRGERGEIEVSLLGNRVWVCLEGAPMQIIGQGSPVSRRAAAPQSQVDIVQPNTTTIYSTPSEPEGPEVPGSEARRSLALIEACYRQRRPLRLPWSEAAPSIV
jgi:hypothetical protein